jgi:GNAT superfamily N-acetyltransferase
MRVSATEVRRARPERLTTLAPVLGRAFVNEPMMTWPLGDHGDLADRFTRCFSYFLEEVLRLGIVWEAGDGDGAAIWIPPRQFEGSERHPWYQERISELADDGGRRYVAFWDWVDSRTPAELWQLDTIGVDPPEQGRGIGRALIETGLARADDDRIGAFLSTGTRGNVSIYGRCGFRLVEDLDAPGGGPHIWFMRWDP